MGVASNDGFERLEAMTDELARCKAMAARAREMARHAYNKRTRTTLLTIAEDYERLVAELEAAAETNSDQPD